VNIFILGLARARNESRGRREHLQARADREPRSSFLLGDIKIEGKPAVAARLRSTPKARRPSFGTLRASIVGWGGRKSLTAPRGSRQQRAEDLQPRKAKRVQLFGAAQITGQQKLCTRRAGRLAKRTRRDRSEAGSSSARVRLSLSSLSLSLSRSSLLPCLTLDVLYWFPVIVALVELNRRSCSSIFSSFSLAATNGLAPDLHLNVSLRASTFQ